VSLHPFRDLHEARRELELRSHELIRLEHELATATRERSQSIAAIVAIAQGYGIHMAALAERLTDRIVGLKRDGFHPLDASLDPIRGPTAPAPEVKPPTEEDQKGWLLITEAIQDRAGEQAELAGRITEDAHRWRALGVPHADIAKRIYAGWEG